MIFVQQFDRLNQIITGALRDDFQGTDGKQRARARARRPQNPKEINHDG